MGKSAPHARVNTRRIGQFAEFVRTLSIEPPLNFYSFRGKDGGEIVASDSYPPLSVPWAIDFFFLVGIHNFGFWHGEEQYEGPLFGMLNGKKVKGSDLLWKLLLRAFQADPASMEVRELAAITRERWGSIMSDDNGVVELLANEERLTLTRAYAQRLFTGGGPVSMVPKEILRLANASHEPAKTLLDILTVKPGIPGYREDPLKKKALLLTHDGACQSPRAFPCSRKDICVGSDRRLPPYAPRTSTWARLSPRRMAAREHRATVYIAGSRKRNSKSRLEGYVNRHQHIGSEYGGDR